MLSIVARALIAGILACGMCGAAGSLMGKLKLNTISLSSAHAALAGAALSLIIGKGETLIPLAFSLSTAMGLGPLSDLLRVHIDRISMVMFSTFSALGLLFIYLYPGPVVSSVVMSTVFWGSVLAVSPSYLCLLISLIVSFSSFLLLSWNKLIPILHSRKLAEAEGINSKKYLYPLIGIVGISIVLGMKIVGGLLVFSMLFNPATAAEKISNKMNLRVILSGILGACSAVLGIFFSYLFNLPVGASIVICSAALLISCSSYAFLKEKVFKGDRQTLNGPH